MVIYYCITSIDMFESHYVHHFPTHSDVTAEVKIFSLLLFPFCVALTMFYNAHRNVTLTVMTLPQEDITLAGYRKGHVVCWLVR